MTSQVFASRLNALLDRFHFPSGLEDRASTFSEYVRLPRKMANMMLNGMLLPRISVVEKIAEELFIDVEELVE